MLAFKEESQQNQALYIILPRHVLSTCLHSVPLAIARRTEACSEMFFITGNASFQIFDGAKTTGTSLSSCLKRFKACSGAAQTIYRRCAPKRYTAVTLANGAYRSSDALKKVYRRDDPKTEYRRNAPELSFLLLGCGFLRFRAGRC